MKNYNSAFVMINMMTTMYMWMFSLCMSLSAAEFGWVSPSKVRRVFAYTIHMVQLRISPEDKSNLPGCLIFVRKELRQ